MIQGMIADAVSLAIGNLYDYREDAYKAGTTVDELDYKICLQVHDAVMSFVRHDHVERYIEEVLPKCLIHDVPIYPCALDGVPTGDKPYYLGIDTEVYIHWGVVPQPDELLNRGIQPKYAHWKPGKGTIKGQPVEGLVQKEAYPGKIWYNNTLQALDQIKKK